MRNTWSQERLASVWPWAVCQQAFTKPKQVPVTGLGTENTTSKKSSSVSELPAYHEYKPFITLLSVRMSTAHPVRSKTEHVTLISKSWSISSWLKDSEDLKKQPNNTVGSQQLPCVCHVIKRTTLFCFCWPCTTHSLKTHYYLQRAVFRKPAQLQQHVTHNQGQGQVRGDGKAIEQHIKRVTRQRWGHGLHPTGQKMFSRSAHAHLLQTSKMSSFNHESK